MVEDPIDEQPQDVEKEFAVQKEPAPWKMERERSGKGRPRTIFSHEKDARPGARNRPDHRCSQRKGWRDKRGADEASSRSQGRSQSKKGKSAAGKRGHADHGARAGRS